MQVEPSTQVGYQAGEQTGEGPSATELIRSVALSSAELWHDVLLRLDEVQRNQAALVQAVSQLGYLVETWMLSGSVPSLAPPPAVELPPFVPLALTPVGSGSALIEFEVTDAPLELLSAVIDTPLESLSEVTEASLESLSEFTDAPTESDEVALETSPVPPAKPERRRFRRARRHGAKGAAPAEPTPELTPELTPEPELLADAEPTPEPWSEVRLEADAIAIEVPTAPEVEFEGSTPSPAKPERRRFRRGRKHRADSAAPESTLDAQGEAHIEADAQVSEESEVSFATLPPPPSFLFVPPPPPAPVFEAPESTLPAAVEEPEPVAFVEPVMVAYIEPEPVVAVVPEPSVGDVGMAFSAQAPMGDDLSFLAQALAPTLAAPETAAPRAPIPLVYTPANAETALVFDAPLPPVIDAAVAPPTIDAAVTFPVIDAAVAPPVIDAALAPPAIDPAVTFPVIDAAVAPPAIDPAVPAAVEVPPPAGTFVPSVPLPEFTLDPIAATGESVGVETVDPVPAGARVRPVEDIHTSASLASEILGTAVPQPAAQVSSTNPMPLVITEDLTLRGKKHKTRLQFRLR